MDPDSYKIQFFSNNNSKINQQIKSFQLKIKKLECDTCHILKGDTCNDVRDICHFLNSFYF